MAHIPFRSETIILAADLTGTTVFAIEGAQSAISGNLDLLGVMIIAFIASLGGGVMRDLLIGFTPPSAIRDWRYPALTFSAGLLTFIFHSTVQEIPHALMLVLDAAGLSLFAVAGVEKALLYKAHPFVAVLMGTVGAVGGGVIRDVLLNRVPAILQTDIYATAALFGTAVVMIGRRAGLSDGTSGLLGGLSCFGLRMLALQYGWHLPKA